MPILTVRISGEPQPALSAAVATALSEATSVHLHKDPAVTAIVIEYVPADRWFVGNRPLAEQGVRSFSLDIKVTHATNTKAEMAAYIEAVFQSMARLLGPVHATSYIVVDEVPAYAWGFGGKTQEYRFIAGRIKTAT